VLRTSSRAFCRSRSRLRGPDRPENCQKTIELTISLTTVLLCRVPDCALFGRSGLRFILLREQHLSHSGCSAIFVHLRRTRILGSALNFSRNFLIEGPAFSQASTRRTPPRVRAWARTFFLNRSSNTGGRPKIRGMFFMNRRGAGQGSPAARPCGRMKLAAFASRANLCSFPCRSPKNLTAPIDVYVGDVAGVQKPRSLPGRDLGPRREVAVLCALAGFFFWGKLCPARQQRNLRCRALPNRRSSAWARAPWLRLRMRRPGTLFAPAPWGRSDNMSPSPSRTPGGGVECRAPDSSTFPSTSVGVPAV